MRVLIHSSSGGTMEIGEDFLRQVVAIILLIAPCLWMSDRFLNRLDPARTDAQRLLIVPGISLFLLLGIIDGVCFFSENYESCRFWLFGV